MNAVIAYSRCTIKTRFLNSEQNYEQQMHLHPGPDAVLTLTWPEISMEKQMMLLERGELYPILCWKNSSYFSARMGCHCLALDELQICINKKLMTCSSG